MTKFQLNIQFIVCAIAAILVVMGESAMAQRPHDFRSEQIALCAQHAACQPGDTVTLTVYRIEGLSELTVQDRVPKGEELEFVIELQVPADTSL